MTITTGLCEVSMNSILVWRANPHGRGLQSWRKNDGRIHRIVRLSQQQGRSVCYSENTVSLMKAVKAAGGSLDRKFFCQKVTPSLEFVARPSEIGIFAKEGKQEILRGNHTNRDNTLIR